MNHYINNNNQNNQNKKSYNHISIEKITNLVNQSKQRAFSIKHAKQIKQKYKISPSKLKTISVNKQLQNKKKSSTNNNNENTFFSSYNGISTIKAQNNNKNTKSKLNINNENNNTNPKNKTTYVKKGIKNYSNNKLRRKMILSVDINNKKSVKNISQYDISNNIKLITDNDRKNSEKINSNNTSSNPLSNGAKNYTSQKPKNISMNNKNKINNVLVKSPEKKYFSNNISKYIEISGDKKYSNNISNNNIINKKINLQIRQPTKLFEQNSSVNLTTSNSSNYKVNFTNSNFYYNNDKKGIKPNLTNSNSNMNYKNNHNNNRNYKNNLNENKSIDMTEKIIKEVLNIENEFVKNLKNNVSNSKSRKYNTIKHYFEVLLKTLGNTIFKNNNGVIKTLFEKILIGYHEVFNAYSMENRKLKQINYNLNEQYEKMSKDLFNNNKLIKEKQKLIVDLQKRISFLESENKKLNLNNNLTYNDQNENNIKVNKNEQNKKIFELNKQNLQDLDALYFYDKVKIKNNSKINDNKEKEKKNVSIPKLVLKQLEEQNEEEEEEYENDNINRTVIFSNVFGMFVNSGDIQFESQMFINLRDAFIL